MARILIITGAILILLGGLLTFLPKIPWLGRLPGDILVKRENMTFYFPLATCILLSLLINLILYLINNR
ncbi:MAG: DUF2905 domain-containing protein [Candidatus Omnitrophica bacterium]|nr:DUF2905 domain-containing protein [Candidatus Omnitrophota bacterium]MCB9721311.1 DUF2905 domain-containing protein [Candidatus Omnitrophota bacterium]